MIGNLGDIVFEVSSNKARTLDELERTASARLASHDVIGGKPYTEFIGPGVETITFEMFLSISLGIAPEEEIQDLRKLRDTGEAVPFVLDGVPQGDGLWVVESLSESWIRQDSRGRPSIIVAGVTLREYLEVRTP